MSEQREMGKTCWIREELDPALLQLQNSLNTAPGSVGLGAGLSKQGHMFKCNLSLDCTEIATNLWGVKELTTGGQAERNCNPAAARRLPRCFQNNYSGFVLVGQL